MDLREFIDHLSKQGHLRRVDREVDWRFELGEMARNNQLPLLFEKIKDYPGQRVFTNGMSSISSMALALGLGPQTRWRAFITEVRRKAAALIEPQVVDTGPVLENVVQAPEINFLDFPVPQWSNHDGGRYLGTWHINVSRDLETGSRNLGVYRMEVLGPNQATVSTSPNSHLARHVAKAEKAGRPLEMAVAIGTSEAIVMAAAAGLPYGTDEYGLAGGLQGEGIRLVRCGTVNLEVPADSEIVIEGVIKPRVRVDDGPYFDYVGTANTNSNAFLFEATRLSFRSDPIFRGTAVGRPGAEDQQVFSVLSALGLFDFHGSRPKHHIQAHLVKRRFFSAFQFVGRMGWKNLRKSLKISPPRSPG
jgi:4-hydroxy-3-polyprenylbenzoate decarboxylase